MPSYHTYLYMRRSVLGVYRYVKELDAFGMYTD